MLSSSLSQKFKFWSFVSMVLLVFVHGYNLEIRYLQPWTAPNETITFTSFVEYLFANGLLRFRIPMLFAISGYLFALHDQAPHGDRIKKRARTLLAPYLIWSAFALVLVFLLEMFPTTREWVMSSQVVQIDNTRKLIHEYQWYEVIARWLFFPVAWVFAGALPIGGAAQFFSHLRCYYSWQLLGLFSLRARGCCSLV